MIEPRRAAVKPRVLSAASGEVVPLEDMVRRHVDAGAWGVVAVLGPAGSGKTTALGHLAAVLPDPDRIAFLDDPSLPEVLTLTDQEPSRLVVVAASSERAVALAGSAPNQREALPATGLLASYRLAPWTEDDRIEYLLAVHKPRCAAVMARVRPADRRLLGGVPELWQIVLDRLVGDDTLPDARTALHRYLEEHLSDTDLLERARSACLNAVLLGDNGLRPALEALARPGFTAGLLRALRHAVAQVLLAAERIAADLHRDADCDYLAKRLPRDLVRAAATLIGQDSPGLDHLYRLLAGPSWSHAMAASLLHALNIGWAPDRARPPFLAGAYLDGASWPGVKLPGASLVDTDLTGANLQEADLSNVVAHKACLRVSRLHAACLEHLDATGADLAGADLSEASAGSARFEGADLSGADLTGATLSGASFFGAHLTGAAFRGATLTGAELRGARLEEADFADADLGGATLSGLRLREAAWAGARFRRAKLNGCDLEYLDFLPGADFQGADLTGALLTGTTMAGACFDGARLREAGLAEVDWPGASLRGADLRGASFHLGSSRSGLVGSPIACEGSRTGFYTDDYEEQTYKAPEEIRKANLCGADLRGARLDGVDFYLVDLRGAQYDPGHEEHLRRSGAILEARV
jgi:uncharacterized protein YjbI with pentapeptide repeats